MRFEKEVEEKISEIVKKMVKLSNETLEATISSDEYAYLTLAEENRFPPGYQFKAIIGMELLTTGHYGQMGQMKIKVIPKEE